MNNCSIKYTLEDKLRKESVRSVGLLTYVEKQLWRPCAVMCSHVMQETRSTHNSKKLGKESKLEV
jgi:hypothetical protein